MRLVEGDQGGDVDRRQAVAIGQAERLAVLEIRLDRLDPTAGHRVFAGIDQGDPPRFAALLVNVDQIIGEIDRHVRRVEEVIGEIFLDQITLVTKADDEVVHAVGRVKLHDVPDDRHSANLDHRLGAHRCLLAQPGAETARKNHRLHPILPENRPPLMRHASESLKKIGQKPSPPATRPDYRGGKARIRTTGPPILPAAGRKIATVRPPASNLR